MTAGGNGDDTVNCMAYDRSNKLVIVGGNTASSDFGPAQSARGFMYALDQYGEMEWSFTYSNKSSSLSSITGCQMSEDGENLIVLGVAKF